MFGVFFAELAEDKICAIDLNGLFGPHPDADASVSLADVFCDAFDTVVPCTTTATAQSNLAEINIELIMHDDDLFEWDFIKMSARRSA